MSNLICRLISLVSLFTFPVAALALQADIRTNHGTISIDLNMEKAPQSVRNFTRYVREGHYNGTIFHRVIAGFMIQGGGYDTRIRRKATHEPVINESDNGLSNTRGTIAMARTRNPDSATSQFYINVVDNPHLDGQPGRPGYTVFGKVIRGMDVVDTIAALPTRAWGQFRNLPVEPVIIESVTLSE
ncbi:MAG: peptidyl-prolyl cis-trans isomerase [Gammaproteobacteria bacterium]|nr:MAG: peptidyl-prolyl cis-trans isomerase [Gammaproteobacteria bacterium]